MLHRTKSTLRALTYVCTLGRTGCWTLSQCTMYHHLVIHTLKVTEGLHKDCLIRTINCVGNLRN